MTDPEIGSLTLTHLIGREPTDPGDGRLLAAYLDGLEEEVQQVAELPSQARRLRAAPSARGVWHFGGDRQGALQVVAQTGLCSRRHIALNWGLRV